MFGDFQPFPMSRLRIIPLKLSFINGCFWFQVAVFVISEHFFGKKHALEIFYAISLCLLLYKFQLLFKRSLHQTSQQTKLHIGRLPTERTGCLGRNGVFVCRFLLNNTMDKAEYGSNKIASLLVIHTC